MAITAIDHTTGRLIQEAALGALRPLADSLGLGVEAAGGRREALAFTAAFRFTVAATAEGVSGEEAQFRQYCQFYNLTPEDYGRIFIYRTRQYQLVGLNPARPKFCVMGRRIPDGKRFAFPRSVLAQLGPAAPEIRIEETE